MIEFVAMRKNQNLVIEVLENNICLFKVAKKSVYIESYRFVWFV